MSDPDPIQEVQRFMDNATKTITDVAIKQVSPQLEKGFDTFIKTLQGVVNKENIEKILELKDEILDLITPILAPIIDSLIGVAKAPMGSSDESVMLEVNEIISTLIMTAVVVAVVTFLPNLAHPFKNIGLERITPLVVQMGGFDRISATIMNILVERTMGARLRYATNTLFTPYIPNANELIRFAVREVITPEQLEFYIKKHGFTPEWGQRYWAAHWELVGIRSLYDMFHRKLITRDDMKKMLIRHDYDEKDEISEGRTVDWPEKLMDISHNLIPRVDIRYAWEAGIIDDAEMIRRMEIIGYSEEDAAIEAVIQKRRTLTTEINAVRSEILKEFREGLITETTTRENLTTLGDTSAAVQFRIDAAMHYADRDHKQNIIKEVEKALGRGDIEETEARTKLEVYMIQDWRIKQIIELAKLKIELKPESVTYTEET